MFSFLNPFRLLRCFKGLTNCPEPSQIFQAAMLVLCGLLGLAIVGLTLSGCRCYGQESLPANKPTLYVFTQEWCAPCVRFKLDWNLERGFREQLSAHFDVVSVDPAKRPDLARRYGVSNVPAFRASNAPYNEQAPGEHTIVGYSGADWLLAHLRPYMRAAAPAAEAPAATRQDLTDAPGATVVDSPAAVPPAEPPIEWSDVEIVVLVAAHDVGALRGKAREFALSAALGPLERAFADATHGKAGVHVVAERTQPQRYAAVSQAAGLHPERAAVLVLIGKQKTGIIGGFIRRHVERVVASKLGGAPVDLVFERTHSADFAAIRAALATHEPAAEPVEGGAPAWIASLPPWAQGAMAGLSMMVAWLLGRVQGRKS